jgi:DNA-binding PadR family transcriptional regulator
MALAHTILASLSIETLSGYDLSKRFAEDSGCFWRATQQQIYRELAKLEDQGTIVSETIPQEGRPDKKLYSITDLGREQLREWIAQPAEPTPIREDLLVKVLAGHLAPRSVILKELERRRQIHLQQLSVYQDLQEQRCQNLHKLPIADQCFCLTLRRGIRYETDWVAWCEEAMQLLTK